MWDVWKRPAQSGRTHSRQKVGAQSPLHRQKWCVVTIDSGWTDFSVSFTARRSGEWSMGSGQSVCTALILSSMTHARSQTRRREVTQRSWNRWERLQVILLRLQSDICWHEMPLRVCPHACFSDVLHVSEILFSNGISSFHNNMQWH